MQRERRSLVKRKRITTTKSHCKEMHRGLQLNAKLRHVSGGHSEVAKTVVMEKAEIRNSLF